MGKRRKNKFISYNFYSMILFETDIIKNKIEEKTGLDLNKDGRVGGDGLAGDVEKATHVDLNRDGVIGGRGAGASK